MQELANKMSTNMWKDTFGLGPLGYSEGFGLGSLRHSVTDRAT